jgi:protein-L-isoaspartate(D-aspartate) O-methyltransferase
MAGAWLTSWRGRAELGGLAVTDRTTEEGHLKGLVDQLRERGVIRSDPVARAFAAIPRHRLLPSLPLERVYQIDQAIPTHFDGEGVPVSSSSAPVIMAVMLEMLEIEPGQRVLEVGAGTGYNAALMGQLVGEDGSVTSIDIDPVVTGEAAANLHRAGIGGVHIVTGDGWLGEPGRTFDREIVTAECWDISPHWVDQLAEGGVLVLPLWLRPGLTLAVAFEKRGGILVSRSLAICGFMALRGPHGGPPRRALVSAVPWESGYGAGESHWIAVFDEASDGPQETLEELLSGVGSARAAPPLFVGWSPRLALDNPDSIWFFPAVPGLARFATGLFDPHVRSLAVVAGETIHWFGDPSCCERLTAFLSEPNPLDLADLQITAAPRASFTESVIGSARLVREHFDFVVTEARRRDNGGN